MLVNKDFQTWHLIGWQHSHQPIRSHVRKSLLTNMELKRILLSNPQPWFMQVTHLWGMQPSHNNVCLGGILSSVLQLGMVHRAIHINMVCVCVYIYIYAVNYDALAQASNFQIERRQLVFLFWMHDSNPGHLEPNLQQTECLLTSLRNYWR